MNHPQRYVGLVDAEQFPQLRFAVGGEACGIGGRVHIVAVERDRVIQGVGIAVT